MIDGGAVQMDGSTLPINEASGALPVVYIAGETAVTAQIDLENSSLSHPVDEVGNISLNDLFEFAVPGSIVLGKISDMRRAKLWAAAASEGWRGGYFEGVEG